MSHMSGEAHWITFGLLFLGGFFCWWLYWKANHLKPLRNPKQR